MFIIKWVKKNVDLTKQIVNFIELLFQNII